MGPQARRVPLEEVSVVALGDYVSAIPAGDLQGHDADLAGVPDAWVTVEGEWLHLTFRCSYPNVYLVIVVQAHDNLVMGHYVLDLNEQYGL